jgi:hypothetical protein
MLRQSVQGRKILHEVNYEQPLSDDTRKALMQTIVATVLAKRKSVQKKEILEIASQITQLFPKEDVSFYINVESGRGILYNRFTNQMKALKQHTGECSSLKRRLNENETSTDDMENVVDDQERISHEFVMRLPANTDFHALSDHWKRSSRLRMKNFRESAEKEGLASMYTALQRSDGYMLVCQFDLKGIKIVYTINEIT